MIKVLGNLFGFLLLLIGLLLFPLNEVLFGIGVILLGLLLISPTSRFLKRQFPQKKWIQPILFLGISTVIIICMASFGRKIYYDSEPSLSEVAQNLSIHPIQTVRLKNEMNYAYLEKGTGPVVVLLHGFPDMASTWDETITNLSRDYRVIAPFLRGYYPTDISSKDDYSVKSVAEDIVLLLDQLGIDKFTIVGQDWGASVAQCVGNLAEDRIYKIVSVAIPHPTCLIPTPSLAIAGRHFFMFGTGDYGVRYARKNDFDYIDRLYQRWSPDYTNYKESCNPIIETFKYPNRLEAALGYYRSFASETDENRTFYNQIPNLPIYFMVGENDGIATPDVIERMKKQMPQGTKTTVFENAGHFLHREIFPQFIKELGFFIEAK